MKLNTIKLSGFRNYKNCRLELDPGLNVFFGKNAQGKTNLLEAVYYLATARSPRTSSSADLVSWGESVASINGEIERESGKDQIGFVLERGGRKRPFIGRKALHRISKLVGVLKSVFFMPDDLALVKSGPAGRRSFLDMGLSQLDSAYMHRLSRYQRVLRQKNALLKRCAAGAVKLEECSVWDQSLARLAAELSMARWRAVVELGRMAAVSHKEITGEALELRYRSSLAGELTEGDEGSFANLEDDYLKGLTKARRVDSLRGYTSLGPHADDISIILNGRSARDFGSQGQQRTVVVVMKMAMCDYFRQRCGEYPILLLDDITSELDRGRQDMLFGYLSKGAQVFLTTTGERKDFSKLRGSYYKVESGKITKEKSY